MSLVAPDVPPTPPPPPPPVLPYSISGPWSVESGEEVIFTLTPTPPDTGVSYQWRKNSVPIASATTSTYSISAATVADAGKYSVVITTTEGSGTPELQLSVKPPAPPVITMLGVPADRYVGEAVEFICSATGSRPVTYQWRKDGQDLPGATAESLRIGAVALADAGSYSVVVTNALGSVTSPTASLSVMPAIAIVISAVGPADTTAAQYSTVSFRVRLRSGSPPLRYEWFKDDTPIPGATADTFQIDVAQLSDAGRYHATVSNPAGTATSRQATLQVTPASPVTIQMQPQSQTVFAGEGFMLTVTASGPAPLTYQWFKDGVPLSNHPEHWVQVSAARLSDAGSYTVVVKNTYGEATSSAAVVTIKPAVLPSFTLQPASVEVPEGEWARFAAAASGSPPLTYQWYCNDVPVLYGTYPELSLQTVSADEAGTYRLEVRNGAGIVSSQSATVTVLPPLAPGMRDLKSISVPLGRSASLGWDLWRAEPDITYQWFKDGQPIARARTLSLHWRDLTPADAGDYFLVTTNRTGSTPSQVARITVLAPASASQWAQVQRQGDVVYFLRNNPGRIERFDLATDTWLPALPLASEPHAMLVTADALYVSRGKTLDRLHLDGTGAAAFSTEFASDVVGLDKLNDALVAYEALPDDDSRLTLVRLSDGVKTVAQTWVWDRWSEVVALPEQNRILTRSSSEPSSFLYLDIRSDGSLRGPERGPYYIDFPAGNRFTVYPDHEHFVDNSGIVYQSSDLRFAGSLGGGFDDISFTESGDPVVLRGSTVHIYRSYVEQRRYASGFAGGRLFVRGDEAVIFGTTGADGSISRLRVPLSLAQPPASAAALDPQTLNFTPDDVFRDKNGVIHLLSKLHRQLFRWSTTERLFLTSLPLQGWPNHVAYSPATHRVYVAYGDARVTQIKLDAATPQEEPFFTSVEAIDALTTAGEFVLLWDSHRSSSVRWCFIVAPDGRLAWAERFGNPSRHYEWNPVNRRLYHFRDWVSPNDLGYTAISTTGAIAAQKDSPYHGDEQLTPRYPIRLTPDGAAVLIGTGRFYDADTLALINGRELGNRIDDAVWVDGRLFTARALATGVQVQRWNDATGTLERSVTVPGKVARLFAHGTNQLLVVASRPESVPTFLFFDLDLATLATPARPVALADQPASQAVGLGQSATLRVVTAANTGAATYTWLKNGAPIGGATAPELTLADFQPRDAGIYTARVAIADGSAESVPFILGPTPRAKATGTASEVGPNIVHPNGNTYDQVLLTGGAASVCADPDQILRISFVDLSGDIVQVEYSGAGTLSVVMDYPSEPAPAVNYVQPGVNYVRGHANIIVTGADETSHLSIFTVGRVTAVNPSLFRYDVDYDGVADIAAIAIHSRNGRFGSLRAANAWCFATRGVTGLFAPGVQFTGPVYLGDISAIDAATPHLSLASTPDLRVAGGSLAQINGAAVRVSELVPCAFTDGTTSHGWTLPAMTNQARFEKDGLDVTSLIVPP